MKFSVCLADLGAQEVKWTQLMTKADLLKWDSRPCVSEDDVLFYGSSSFLLYCTTPAHTHEASQLGIAFAVPNQTHSSLLMLLCGTTEKVIHISQILHPSLRKHLLHSGLVSSPSAEHTVLLKWCFSFASFIQSQSRWGWKGMLETF